jgi:hypothetical protein
MTETLIKIALNGTPGLVRVFFVGKKTFIHTFPKYERFGSEPRFHPVREEDSNALEF